MKTLLFYWMMLTGSIKPMGEHEGRKFYTMYFKDGKVIDFAYKGEIKRYLKTGVFIYDEDLKDTVVEWKPE